MKKKTSFAFFKMLLKRAFGFNFLSSLLLICLVFFLDTEPSVRNVLMGKYAPEQYQSISFYFEGVLLYGVNYKLFLVFMTLGFTVVFPTDWKHKIIPNIVQRLGLKKYSLIQVGLSALSGGLSVSGGFLLYLLIMRSKFPLISEGEDMYNMYEFLLDMPYYQGISKSDAQTFVLCMLVIFFLSGATWSAFAAGLSSYLNNTYIVLVFPYLLSRTYIEAAKFFRIPAEFRLDRWFSGLVQPFPIPICLAILAMICLLIFMISKKFFAKGLRWRLENG